MFNLILNATYNQKVLNFSLLASLFISFSFHNSPVFSQTIIDVKGKVVDSASGKNMVAVSVTINKYKGTITNSKGEFHLSIDESLIKEKGLTFTYVGYKKKHVSFMQNILFKIEMSPAENNIGQVVVYAGGKSIIQKAIEKIPFNYPLKPFVQTGLTRIYNTVGDSDYFYKSDAYVEVHFPSYLDHSKNIEIKVIENKQILLKNPKYEPDVKWVGGFASIFDVVHEYPAFINKNKLSNYEYHEKEKIILDGRKVFVIDFNAIKNNNIEGTLYIDTATYAFIGADITQNNISEFGFVPISVAKETIRYQIIGDKWYVKNSNSESKHVMKIENNNYTRDYIALSIDTTNTASFAYKDVIQHRDENIKILKSSINDSAINDSMLNKLEANGDIRYMDVPAIDTSTKNTKTKKSFFRTVFNYLRNDNLRGTYFIAKMPVKINPAASKPTLTVYSFGNDAQFRIYKNLFFTYDWQSNFGIGKLKIVQIGYYINYVFKINKEHRPISISPLVGYNYIRISNKSKTENGKIDNWAARVITSIEITHRKEFFVSGLYNYTFKKNISGLVVQPTNIGLSAGILFKL